LFHTIINQNTEANY